MFRSPKPKRERCGRRLPPPARQQQPAQGVRQPGLHAQLMSLLHFVMAAPWLLPLPARLTVFALCKRVLTSLSRPTAPWSSQLVCGPHRQAVAPNNCSNLPASLLLTRCSASRVLLLKSKGCTDRATRSPSQPAVRARAAAPAHTLLASRPPKQSQIGVRNNHLPG